MHRRTVRNVGIIVLIATVAVLLRLFHFEEYLLAYIKESQHRFAAMYVDHRIAVIGAYMFVYIAVSALSLPGAVVMTLAGGALFGLWTGTLIVSFASSIGATLACFISRFVLRDWVQGKFGDKLSVVNEGIAKEGAFYLFTLRLIPVFPFFMINLVMGLTKMPLRTFYWVSQLGMFAGTMVYVNAGKELGKIESLRGILSPGLIISFVLLGVFPIVAKKMISAYKSRKEIN
ncbi:MAG: TVP38/TMEM64 family protein, partial [Nitrospirae bacterium]|nr:TVP38/TMEM64 family protein [Nitrospirota bacterium]